MYQILIKYTKKTKIKNENRGEGGGGSFLKIENLNDYLFIERFGV